MDKPVSIERRRLGRLVLALGLGGALTSTLTACGGGGDGPPPVVDDPRFALKDGAIQVDAGNATLVSQDDASITLSGRVTNQLKVGDIIVSTLGDGALRRVTALQSGPDGVRYSTEQVGLIDAFDRFDLSFDQALTPELLGSHFDTGHPGVTLEWAPANARAQANQVGPQASGSATLRVSFPEWTLSQGLRLEGYADFSVTPVMKVGLETPPGDKLPTVVFDASVTASYDHLLTLASEFGGSISGKEEITVPLGRIVNIAPPVVITPVLVLRAAAYGTAAGEFRLEHTASMSGTAWVKRDASGTEDAGHSFAPAQGGTFASVEATFAAGMRPILEASLEFRLYGIGGPRVALSGNVGAEGKFWVDGTTGDEGILAKAEADLQLTLAIDGRLDLYKKLFKGKSGDFTLVRKDFTLLSKSFEQFFKFSGAAAIQVRDNGNVPDDIFEVSVDGVVLGRTSKGGSGQFRIGTLKPGEHTLELRTVEDDSPPGTWEITLAEGVTFADGSTRASGGLRLGQALSFTLIVPAG